MEADKWKTEYATQLKWLARLSHAHVSKIQKYTQYRLK